MSAVGRVLIWHGDNGLMVYDATDELRAYRRMFDDMDEAQMWEPVSDPIVETDPPTRDTPEVRGRRLYHEAKDGNDQAARELCLIATRDGWEYQDSGVYEVDRG